MFRSLGLNMKKKSIVTIIDHFKSLDLSLDLSWPFQFKHCHPFLKSSTFLSVLHGTYTPYLAITSLSFFSRHSFPFVMTMTYMMEIGNHAGIVNSTKTIFEGKPAQRPKNRISFLMQTLIHVLFSLDLQVLFISCCVLSKQPPIWSWKEMSEMREYSLSNLKHKKMF